MAEILRDRDPNLQAEQAADAAGKQTDKATNMQDRLKDNKSNQNSTYISPSDAIMSLASKKLSNLKQKQIGKSMPKRSLFARAVTSREKDLGPE
ncbi:hypothetical protein BDZ85DRAFT_316163 [Elsinoe ampelina]|uniref:Uncharacterized protein n=1 Tax=Elsinoe ampelina TaxID=302913 RepID=A0A6A6GLS1_9PEZI|nr:hypothetical protein BDZ85DRAFT_316163 [Elsinoe ampelina]